MNERHFRLVLDQIAVSRFPARHVVGVDEHNATTSWKAISVIHSIALGRVLTSGLRPAQANTVLADKHSPLRG